MDPSARVLKEIPLRIYYAKYTNASVRSKFLKVLIGTLAFIIIYPNERIVKARKNKS